MYSRATSDLPTGIRVINQLRVLNALRQQPGLSRTAIARQTGLGKATISLLVADFIRRGLVHETESDGRSRSAGRRPVGLELNGAAYRAVGIELTGTECIAVLTDLAGTTLRLLRYPMALTSVDLSVKTVVQAVSDLMEDYDETTLLGVGVGIPGTVDSLRQRVLLAENFGWVDVPFGSRLAEHLDHPVTLINRTNAGAVGELRRGSVQGIDTLIYVSINVGVGAGIIITGMLYEGASGSAGEIGHITVDPDGQLCTCGNRGCLETLVSTRALAVRAKQKIKEGAASLLVEKTGGNLELITGNLVVAAAAAGDSTALGIVEEAAAYLGIALANVINLFNPTLVVVDGDMLKLGELFMEPVRRMVQRRAFSIPLSAVRLVPSGLRHQAAAIGAACIVIDSAFVGAQNIATRGHATEL